MPEIVVIMGVAGCGKTTVGQALAKAAGGVFFDGDDFHPPENVAKMRSGTPLTDGDRMAYLAAIRDLITVEKTRTRPVFIACSALKKKYRDILREGSPDVFFVFLSGSPELLRERMRTRTDHFMPPSLLESQFETLEPPEDENALTIDVSNPPETLTIKILEKLGLR